MSQPGPGTPNPWKVFAKARGLRFVGPSSVFVHERSNVLEGVIDDVALVVDACMEASRDRFVTHTRVTGRAVAPVPLRLAVQSRQGGAEIPDGALRGLDDPEFDQRFAVKATPAEPVRKMLGEDVRLALLRFPEPLVLQYDGSEARLFWEGVEKDVDTLALGTEVVLAACRFRRSGGYR